MLDLYKYKVMKPSERPPLKPKKGIQIFQPCSPKPRHQGTFKDSVSASINSQGRSRGISMSRETGITVDKIYDLKHFLPPKNATQNTSTAESASSKRLSSAKSLKLISMFGESQV